jgi:myo-inositol-1(or 4)-monophosphatase
VGELRAVRPEDGFLAEEGAGEAGTSGRRWVIDPLDGTVNFLYGIPLWAVSVAVEDERGTLAGVVHDPSRGEVVAAARGEGCFLEGEPVRVRDPGSLAMALVATGFAYDPAFRGRQAEVAARVIPRARDIRRGGAAALELAWVAAGRVDA